MISNMAINGLTTQESGHEQTWQWANNVGTFQYRLRIEFASYNYLRLPWCMEPYSTVFLQCRKIVIAYHDIRTFPLGVIIIAPLWNLTGTSAALLPRDLSNFRAIENVKTRISRLRDFTRSCSKTSYRLVNRGPESDAVPSLRSCCDIYKVTGSLVVKQSDAMP